MTKFFSKFERERVDWGGIYLRFLKFLIKLLETQFNVDIRNNHDERETMFNRDYRGLQAVLSKSSNRKISAVLIENTSKHHRF